MEDDPSKPLRRGWTTGACATAAATAALQALVHDRAPGSVAVTLPKGLSHVFAVHALDRSGASATATVVKDAGDDPDITHGAEISATVAPGPRGAGLTFKAGPGVGTVTKPGLPLPPGEPAINPGPRAQIEANLRALMGPEAALDFVVTLSIANGEKLARKTMNARLGIVGGLSVLGTTGLVVPYSCSAWIASIHRGIDVARASGLDHIAASTGRTSERAVKGLYGLADEALIEMGDFAGGALKYLKTHPVPRLTIAGGFAKLAKLAAGHMDLHSKRSGVDVGFLARLAADAGGSSVTVDAVAAASSGAQALQAAAEGGLALADAVAAKARDVARGVVDNAGVTIDVAVFDRQGRQVGHAV